jgi:protein ImuB
MKRVLCVWFPQWPLQRLLLERPELRNRPVVIAGRGTRGREVRFASRPARDLGVTVGQPLAEAEALLEPPPGTRSTWGAATILPEDRAADRLALEQRALWCQRYSPLVGLVDSPTPEALLISLDGCAHLLGGENPLARQIAHDLERGGHHVRLAVAPTTGAAWGLARHFARPNEELLITPPGALATDPACRGWLDLLPLAALRLKPSLLELLDELGVTTVGELRQLPRSSLPSRLGPEILRRLDQLDGLAPEEIVPLTPPEPAVRDWSFDEPVGDRTILETVLWQLLGDLLADLERQHRGIRRLDCRLFCPGHEVVVLSVGAVRPRSQVRHWHDLLRLQLERQPLPADVVRVQIEGLALAPLETGQVTLFVDRAQQAQDREWEGLLERLGSRLGETAVLRPCVAPEHQPEWAGRYDPVGTEPERLPPARVRTTPESAHPAPAPADPLPPLSRPLSLQSRPVAIEVLALAPAGTPARFSWTGDEHRVERCWGPERIEAGWWQGTHSRRDYYRVETTAGQRFWLFREQAEQPSTAWFLQGAFD